MITSDTTSSYSNVDVTKQRFMSKIAIKNVQDDELGVFGAEKYFKGIMEEEHIRTFNNGHHHHSNRPQEEPYRLSKSKTTSSVRSDSSWNSMRGLLVGNGNKQSKKLTSFKRWLFASFGCNCNDKDSVKITQAKHAIKGSDLCPKMKSLSSRWADDDINKIKREDRFTFPVLNHAMTYDKCMKLPEVEQQRDVKTYSFSLNEVTPKAETLEVSRNDGENDTGSDVSSELFELESFSTNENNSFLARQAMANNIDRSVAGVGVLAFSATNDLTVTAKQKTFHVARSVHQMHALNCS